MSLIFVRTFLIFYQGDPETVHAQLRQEGILGIVIAVVLMSGLAWFYRQRLKEDYSKPEALLFTKIQDRYLQTLKKYLRYYNQLPPSEQRLFEKRVQKFIDLKHFIPRDMAEVTDEMKALIAGSAIQLMNGFPKIYFSHFKRILIYPDSYYSLISRRYHKGEVNSRGLIVLSWKNFVEGFIVHEDGRNLGLHEMAHALRLENAISNKDYGFLDENVLKEWTDLSYMEMHRMKKGKSDFFRSYAATNTHEFFAVAVENFFERSAEFKKWNPRMYNTLAEMLKQDPLRLGGEVES